MIHTSTSRPSVLGAPVFIMYQSHFFKKLKPTIISNLRNSLLWNSTEVLTLVLHNALSIHLEWLLPKDQIQMSIPGEEKETLLERTDSDISQNTFLSRVKLKCITLLLLSFHPGYPGFSVRNLIASLWVMGYFCR